MDGTENANGLVTLSLGGTERWDIPWREKSKGGNCRAG